MSSLPLMALVGSEDGEYSWLILLDCVYFGKPSSDLLLRHLCRLHSLIRFLIFFGSVKLVLVGLRTCL